jgi:enediyne biosynthesis protein E4
VEIVTDEGHQYSSDRTAGSYESSSDPRVHFGLGPATMVKTIQIHWPSGIEQTLKEVKADQILTVTEPGPS